MTTTGTIVPPLTPPVTTMVQIHHANNDFRCFYCNKDMPKTWLMPTCLTCWVMLPYCSPCETAGWRWHCPVCGCHTCELNAHCDTPGNEIIKTKLKTPEATYNFVPYFVRTAYGSTIPDGGPDECEDCLNFTWECVCDIDNCGNQLSPETRFTRLEWETGQIKDDEQLGVTCELCGCHVWECACCGCSTPHTNQQSKDEVTATATA